MVLLCTLNQEIANTKQFIKVKSKHQFIEKYIKEPTIDMEKLTMLHHIYNHINLPISKKQQYITTIMLIQIALDTHEHVPSQTNNKTENTAKQLAVLAGDYYSVLYYLLLSELEDVEMVQVLASAIKQINEFKMKLYYQEIKSIKALKLTVKNIESLLFTNTASHLDESFIIPVIEEWFLLNRLVREKECFLQNKDNPFIRFVKSDVPKQCYNSKVDLIEEEISITVHTLQNLLNDIPIHLIGLKSYITDSLMKKIYKTKSPSMVEEG